MKLSTPLEIALVARAARAVKDNLAQRSVLKYLHVNRMTRTRECQNSEIHGTKWRIGVVKSQRSPRRHESVVMCLSWTEEFCLTSTCLLHVLWRAYTRRLWYKHLSAHVYGVCVCVWYTLRRYWTWFRTINGAMQHAWKMSEVLWQWLLHCLIALNVAHLENYCFTRQKTVLVKWLHREVGVWVGLAGWRPTVEDCFMVFKDT